MNHNRDIQHDWRALAILAILAALGLLFLWTFAANAAGPGASHAAQGGCLQQSTYEATDAAAQRIRYHLPAGQALARALSVANRNHAPAWVIRRILLAERYHARGLDGLAQRHLFYISRHVCW